MNLIEYPDRELMFLSLANEIAGQVTQAVRLNGKATLAVPGGTTPGPIFDTLSGVDLGWDQVTVVLTDERWVPESSPRSNTRLLREHLLRGPAARAHLVPLHAAGDRPEDQIAALAEGIAPHLPITVLLLGMGADLHIASLFPGADRLAEALAPDAPILMALRADAADKPRVSLTAPVLAAAMHVHIVITGPEKRAALDRVSQMTVQQAPVRAVLDIATVHWAE